MRALDKSTRQSVFGLVRCSGGEDREDECGGRWSLFMASNQDPPSHNGDCNNHASPQETAEGREGRINGSTVPYNSALDGAAGALGFGA